MIAGRTIPSWTSEMKVGAGDVRDGPGSLSLNQELQSVIPVSLGATEAQGG